MLVVLVRKSGRRVISRIRSKSTFARRGLRSFSVTPLKIHPAIGVARLGNAGKQADTSSTLVPPNADDWMVAPIIIGGMPRDPSNQDMAVTKMKNANGEIKRQAAKFTLYKSNGDPLDFSEVEYVRWKVYLANKKSVWWEFSRLSGYRQIRNVPDNPDRVPPSIDGNTYDDWAQVEDRNSGADPPNNVIFKRNAGFQNAKEKFQINPGPREVSYPSGNSIARFDASTKSMDGSFPQEALTENGLGNMFPEDITTLGDMNMTTSGDVSLFVRGGYGIWGGWDGADITSYAGADGLFDDTSDGPVECVVKLTGDTEEQTLSAYVVCAQPNVAPEIDNINTWDDVVFDIAIRYWVHGRNLGFVGPDNRFIKGAGGYHPNIARDIEPIFKRMRNYQWVANIAPMTAFASPTWDIFDPTPELLQNRQQWFSLLREATDLNADVYDPPEDNTSHQDLYVGGEATGDTYLAQPLNAGSGSVQPNSVTGVMSKFITMTPTQYYMLYQWSQGHTTSVETPFDFVNHPLDRADIGNCVGYPSSPGIEVAWNVRAPVIYDPDDPYRLSTVPMSYLEEYGLSDVAEMRDETDVGNRIEGRSIMPGDLSKRMAVPWLADFTYCSVQSINFTDPQVNKWETDKDSPSTTGDDWKLPLYYAYWWPAASPYNVYVGARTQAEAEAELTTPDGYPIASTGQNVGYQRGTDDGDVTYVLDMWQWFGFITNANKTNGDLFPNFVETERNYAEIKDYVTTRKEKEEEETLTLSEELKEKRRQRMAHHRIRRNFAGR